MENDIIHVSISDIEIVNSSKYVEDINSHFQNLPEITKPLVQQAKKTFSKIEQALYSAPSFFNLLKAFVPQETLQAIITNEQKAQIANGTLKLMTKKDGTLIANLVNPETKKIVSTIPLQNVNISPDFSQALANFSSQMQMAEIAEQIQTVQVAIEEVRQGHNKSRSRKENKKSI